METSLHRELKRIYAGDAAQMEVRLGAYRVDAVVDGLLIEIQHGSLAALRDKVRKLATKHRVLVVKPIVARKRIVHFDGPGGRILKERMSPKRGQLVDLFHELVYFTRTFPHRNLAIEAVLVEIAEHRHPGHGKRRRWRRNDFVVADQHLLSVGDGVRLETAADLVKLLPGKLRKEFDTGELAADMDLPRWVAQRIAYCLREAGTIRVAGKRGNAVIYRPVRSRRSRRAA